MKYTLFDTPIVTPILRMVSRLFLWLLGWETIGEMPTAPKCVVIGAPHTSNWDFPLMVSCVYVFRAKASWMGKKSIFFWPAGPILRWLGGIPIDRSKHSNMVEQAVRIMNESERLLMVIPPEGTRSKVTKWKTGFYYVALGSSVPIALGLLDYKRKRVGFGPTYMPTGIINEDMKFFAEFYKNIAAKYPDKFSLPGFSESA